MQERLEENMSFWLDLDQDLNFELGMKFKLELSTA